MDIWKSCLRPTWSLVLALEWTTDFSFTYNINKNYNWIVIKKESVINFLQVPVSAGRRMKTTPPNESVGSRIKFHFLWKGFEKFCKIWEEREGNQIPKSKPKENPRNISLGKSCFQNINNFILVFILMWV